MNNKDKTCRGSSGRDASANGIDPKRRSLTRLGLSTPVLMTLASRPALAKDCSMSAWNSGNMSDPVVESTCGSCTNEQWFNANTVNWQNAGMSGEESFGLSFPVPIVKYQSVEQPLVEGTVREALSGQLTVSLGAKYQLAGLPYEKALGDLMLREMFAYLMANLMNLKLPVTRLNLTNDPDQFRDELVRYVLDALAFDSAGRMSYTSLSDAAAECKNLMSDGRSCALS